MHFKNTEQMYYGESCKPKEKNPNQSSLELASQKALLIISISYY